MKSILVFVRTTLTGGILFLLPVILLGMIFSKVNGILIKLSAPIADKLPEIIFGFNGSKLIAIVLLLLLCFLGGVLFRLKFVKRWVGLLEENILVYLPGYSLIKSITAGAIGEEADINMLPILVKDEEKWNFGFLVEEGKSNSTVFLPEAPKHDSGDIMIVPNTSIKKLDIKTNKFAKSINNFGKGVVHLIE